AAARLQTTGEYRIFWGGQHSSRRPPLPRAPTAKPMRQVPSVLGSVDQNRELSPQVGGVRVPPRCAMRARGPAGRLSRVKLTKEDWLEIYFALHTKVTLIATYGTEDEPGQDQAWIRNIRRTMAKI